MLMGLKARAEAGAGVRLSNASDNLWLAEVFLSGIGVALLMVVGGGVAGAVSSVLLGVAWLWVVLVADPRPVPALGVLIAVSLVLAWLR